MLKALLIGLAIIIIVVVVLSITHCGGDGGFPFVGSSGEGEGVVFVFAEDSQLPDNVYFPDEIPITLIEIHEDRIIYDNDEITLDELSVILARFRGTEYTWTLTDAFRADKATFDSVRELLRENYLPVAEN